jgi:hypothetical protein
MGKESSYLQNQSNPQNVRRLVKYRNTNRPTTIQGLQLNNPQSRHFVVKISGLKNCSKRLRHTLQIERGQRSPRTESINITNQTILATLIVLGMMDYYRIVSINILQILGL